jgi:hypothetical protein
MEIAGSITNVGWSQDSKSIYYDVRDYDKSNIYIINLSTSPSPILNNEYYDLVLGEIEENALLVYSDRYPQGFLIVNLDGSVERGFEMDTMPQSYPAIQDIQIIPNSNGDFTYSECERSLQYFTCSIYMNNIYVPGRKDLITLPGEYIWKENLFRYRFSKDNEKLIIEHAKFLSQEFWDQGPIKLSVLDLTSGELITITNTEESMDYWADWLPDERHLIYVHLNLLDYTQENLTLRLSLSDGSEALDITDNYDSLIYAWSE